MKESNRDKTQGSGSSIKCLRAIGAEENKRELRKESPDTRTEENLRIRLRMQ